MINYFYSHKCYFFNLIGTFFLNKPVATNMSFCISQELQNHKSKLFYDSHLHFIFWTIEKLSKGWKVTLLTSYYEKPKYVSDVNWELWKINELKKMCQCLQNMRSKVYLFSLIAFYLWNTLYNINVFGHM